MGETQDQDVQRNATLQPLIDSMASKVRVTAIVPISRMRRRRWVALIVIAVVVALGFGVALSMYQLSVTAPLMLQANDLPVADARVARQQQILQFQADNLAKIWTTIVQAVVGVVLGIGAYFTWRNIGVAQEGQITNRFTQAINQLGSEKDGKPNVEVRLGSVYALERIAHDSPRDHWAIMEILTTYVRENAPCIPQSGPVADRKSDPSGQPVKRDAVVQAILTIIGRRTVSEQHPEFGRLDLSRTDLSRADLRGANLAAADLSWANLDGADLRRATVAGAILFRANISRAVLVGADFTGAVLSGAVLNWADISHAAMTGANLSWADLTEVRGLREEQLTSAASWEGARLPAQFAHVERRDVKASVRPSTTAVGESTADSTTTSGHSTAVIGQPRRRGRKEEDSVLIPKELVARFHLADAHDLVGLIANYDAAVASAYEQGLNAVSIPKEYVEKFGLSDAHDVMGLIYNFEGVVKTAYDQGYAAARPGAADAEKATA